MPEPTEPRWMKRPSCPGIWVCHGDRSDHSRVDCVLKLSKEDLEFGSPFRTAMVYGPIPSPPDEIA